MAMYAKVRRMRVRDGLSISEIAHQTSLSRNTIKQWLRAPVRREMTYQRSAGPKKISPFETGLREALETDARRPRRERRTATSCTRSCRPKGVQAAMRGSQNAFARGARRKAGRSRISR